MKHDLIRNWLGLPAGNWPPTHYELLGLPPCEGNLALIEERLQQRLEKVRCYQLTHPEQATEALNRLAQAYCCLTEPSAKSRYDSQIGGSQFGASDTVALLEPVLRTNPCVSTDTPVPGRFPKPVRANSSRPRAVVPPPLPSAPNASAQTLEVPGITPTLPEIELLDDAAIEATLPPLQPSVDFPDRPPICPIEEAARSRAACVGLCTRGALLRRFRLLRRLQATWNNVGRLLPSASPGARRINPRTRGQALIRHLEKMQELLTQFPAIFGDAGQPGFLVLGLLEQEKTVFGLQNLDEERRLKLTDDWRAGHDLLRAHGRLLQEMTARFRGLCLFGRLRLALATAFVQQPVYAYALLALVAGNFGLWGWYAYRWFSGI